MDENTMPKNDQLLTPEMVAQPVQSSSAAEEQSPDEPPVKPVRSAKDAINAMYAQNPDKRLSNYLATSAKEIINANNRTSGNNRSASNLHRGSIRHKVEARPSASGLLRSSQKETIITPSDTSSAMDPLARKTAPASKPQSVKIAPVAPPVVKTSLKLSPKKAPITMAPQSARPNRIRPTMAPVTSKNPTALSKLLANRRKAQSRANQQHHKDTADSQPVAAPQQPQKISRPHTHAPRGLMQDVIRPAGATPHHATGSAAPNPTDVIAQATAAATRRQSARPLDSVKRRFRPVPKDYTATATTQESGYVGYDQPISRKTPVDIYGLMDEEPTGAKPSDLGIVQDYVPSGDSVSAGIKEQKVATGSGTIPPDAPDNNKYSIKGQSPFFLKSVNVEKRPLSDSPLQNLDSPKGTLYERPSTAPVDKKNSYDQPAKKPTKATIPTKPTVIIPASRRSKAPLIFLLILTVVLGAAVGAFIYLLFFQYMD